MLPCQLSNVSSPSFFLTHNVGESQPSHGKQGSYWLNFYEEIGITILNSAVTSYRGTFGVSIKNKRGPTSRNKVVREEI